MTLQLRQHPKEETNKVLQKKGKHYLGLVPHKHKINQSIRDLIELRLPPQQENKIKILEVNKTLEWDLPLRAKIIIQKTT